MTRMPDLGRCVIREPATMQGHSRRVQRLSPDADRVARLVLYELATGRDERSGRLLSFNFSVLA